MVGRDGFEPSFPALQTGTLPIVLSAHKLVSRARLELARPESTRVTTEDATITLYLPMI